MELTGKSATERKRRIRLTVAAYSYEFLDFSIISDAEFDRLCLEVDLSIDTDRPDLDQWWRENFTPYTGQWIRSHPEKPRLEKIAKGIKNLKPKESY